MNKDILKKVIPIIICIIVFIIVFSLTRVLMNKKASVNTINFYNGSNIYKIEPKNRYIKVEKLIEVECITDPCYPIRESSYKIKYSDENKKLLKKLDGKTKVTVEDLEDDELEIVSAIIKEKVSKEEKLSYEIVTPKERTNKGYPKYVKRGYYVEEYDSKKTLVVIAMGAKNSGGYSIEISKIAENNSEVIIYVKEISPNHGDNVTNAFTYPITGVEFNEKPTKITVYNIDTNESFEQLINSNF